MTNIEYYLNDGANYKAQAVMCLLRNSACHVECDVHDDKIYDDYEDIIKPIDFRVEVGRYENCREQGYVFTLNCNYDNVAHYCVFEHRNSDQVCVIRFKGSFINTPSNEDIWKDRESKYDTDADFEPDDIVQCCEWIKSDMSATCLEYLKEKYIPRVLASREKWNNISQE